ncbi:MAG: 4-hydroxythreonine-4-phosphate dehydrogenase PdxA [Rhodospirillaceae bacterium]|nr:4-hydroxythreonine-4-phosphate dehydrogenase PdxA [Rhodospirillaceae bacterium]
MINSNELISIIMGEPSGIGPEIIIKSWLKKISSKRKFFVIGDYNFFIKWKKILRSEIPIKKIESPREAHKIFNEYLPIIDVPFLHDFKPGIPNIKNKESILNSIKKGVEYINNNKSVSIITCPIQKDIFYGDTFKYPGLTEYLGSLVKDNSTPTMMLYSSKIKIIIITTHILLKDVNKHLNTNEIFNKVKITIEYLKKYFCIEKPNVAIAGLNPHLGEIEKENNEEKKIIIPAINQLRGEGYNVNGPYSSDSLFYKENRKKFDLIVCMYHDQGLIPIKTIDFWKTVNITLGLPFLRVSPDHGPALDIAGKGIGNPSSLLQAIEVTNSILDNKQKIYE